MRRRAFLFSTVLCATNASADPISWNTQLNCASDYYAYCSKFSAGSAGCHACMRANGPRLSKACVSALVDDGVMSKADAAPRSEKIAVTKPSAEPPSVAKAKPGTKPAAIEPDTENLPQKHEDHARLALDQQTFEALKNRAARFVAKPEFEITEANVLPQSPTAPR